MEDTLKELCREARDRQNITIQDLADETGISISTIGNFFATKSKAPNVYNAGAICAVLGVSLDRYFGIIEMLPPEDQMAQLQHDHHNELEIARLEGSMEQMAKTIDYQRKKTRITQFAIYGLMLVCAIFWRLSWAISSLTTVCPTRGLFRAERPAYSHGSSFCCLPSASAFLPPFLSWPCVTQRTHTPGLNV